MSRTVEMMPQRMSNQHKKHRYDAFLQTKKNTPLFTSN